MDLENIMLGKVTQTQTDKHCMLTHMQILASDFQICVFNLECLWGLRSQKGSWEVAWGQGLEGGRGIEHKSAEVRKSGTGVAKYAEMKQKGLIQTQKKSIKPFGNIIFVS